MKLLVADLRAVETPKLGRCVRFSITAQEESGEALMTTAGFLFTPDRNILPPATRTKFGGRLMSFVTFTPKFEATLKKVLLKMDGVTDIIGEQPVEENRIEGEAEI